MTRTFISLAAICLFTSAAAAQTGSVEPSLGGTTPPTTLEKASDYSPAEVPPAESVLPRETIALATIPNVRDFKRRWDRSSFGQMAADPAFGPFFGDVRTRMSTLSTAFGLDVPRLWEQIDGELAIGLTPSAPGLALIGIANFDADPDQADALIAQLESQLQQSGGKQTTIEADGRRLTSWTTEAAGRNRAQALAYYRDGGHVVFADGLSALLDIAATRDRDASLAASDAYQRVKDETRPGVGQAAIRWYVNPAAAVDAAVTLDAGGPGVGVIRNLLDRSGLNQFRGFGGLFDLPGGGLDSVSSTYGYVEQPAHGLLQAFVMPATSQRPPDWVKDDVSLYSQMNFQPRRLVETVRNAVDKTRGEGAFEASVLSQTLGGSDVTVGELVELFGGPIHFAAEVPESAADLTRQSTIVSLGVRDTKRLKDVVSRLADGTTATTQQAGETAVYTVPLTLQVPDGTPLTALASPELAIAAGADGLMLSTDSRYLVKTLAGQGSGRPLAESPDYAEIAANFPKQTSVINYQRQDGRFAGLYEELRRGSLPAVGTTGLLASALGFDFKMLPPFSAMSRYLQSTGGYIVPAEEGFRIVNFALEPRER